MRLERVEPDEHDREEDDIDQDEDNDGNASPLKPEHLSYTAIDSSSGPCAYAAGKRRQSSAAVSLGLVIAPHVLQINFDAVHESGSLISDDQWRILSETYVAS